jgi:hypothetical protein
MHDYPIMRLVAKWPRFSQAIGVVGIVSAAFWLLAPASDVAVYATGTFVLVLATFLVLCFVELVCLMANTLLPR